MTLKEKYEKEKAEIEAIAKDLLSSKVFDYVYVERKEGNTAGSMSVLYATIEFVKENQNEILKKAAGFELEKIGE